MRGAYLLANKALRSEALMISNGTLAFNLTGGVRKSIHKAGCEMTRRSEFVGYQCSLVTALADPSVMALKAEESTNRTRPEIKLHNRDKNGANV